MCLNKRISAALSARSEAVHEVTVHTQGQTAVEEQGMQLVSQQSFALDYN